MHDTARHSDAHTPETVASVIELSDRRGWRYEIPALACAGAGVAAALAAGAGGHVELGALAGVTLVSAALLLEQRDRQARKRLERVEAGIIAFSGPLFRHGKPSEMTAELLERLAKTTDVRLRRIGSEPGGDVFEIADLKRENASFVPPQRLQDGVAVDGHLLDGPGASAQGVDQADHGALHLVPELLVDHASPSLHSPDESCLPSGHLSIPPFAPSPSGAETRGPVPVPPPGPRTPGAAK